MAGSKMLLTAAVHSCVQNQPLGFATYMCTLAAFVQISTVQ